jgi:hypothetical protein
VGVRFSHPLEELLRHNIPDALLCVAQAWIFSVIHKVISVIEGDFFAGFDAPLRHNPNMAAVPLYFAIG